MPKKLLIILAGFVVVTGIVYLLIPTSTSPLGKRTYPAHGDYTTLSIHELQNPELTGTYNTEGYVIKSYKCPPCPKGAVCSPCMGEYIIISEQEESISLDTLTDKEMMIFVNNPAQFELGNKYIFSLKINPGSRGMRINGRAIKDTEILGFDLMSSESAIVDKPPIVDHFACSDNCPGPEELYIKKVYQGVTDDEECKKLGGTPYTYTGWIEYHICLAE